MNTADFIKHAAQIEKSNKEGNHENTTSLLSTLDEANITVEHLRETGIVVVLYRVLKNCSHPSVKTKVKQLLSNWKKQYNCQAHHLRESGKSSDESTIEEKGVQCHAWHGTHFSAGVTTCVVEVQGASSSEPGSSPGSSPDSLPAEGTGCVQTVGEEMTPSNEHLTSRRLSVNSGPPAASLEASLPASEDNSVLRSKCTQLLLTALTPEATEEAGGDRNTAELARSIETHIHTLLSVNQAKYKACIRSKVANLKNPKCGHLRRDLLTGSLAPEAFARMSAQEMAGKELQRLREEYSSQGVSERQLPTGVDGTPTRKLRCRRCQSSDCKVSQVSRGTLFLPSWVRRGSPDEDAMTFVTCAGCGEQWYHSGWVCL